MSRKPIDNLLTSYDLSLKEERGPKTVFFFVLLQNLIFTVLLLLTSQSSTYNLIATLVNIQSDISEILSFLVQPTICKIFLSAIGFYLLLIIIQHIYLALGQGNHTFQRTLSELYQYCLFMPIIFTLSYCLIYNFKQKNIIYIVVIAAFLAACLLYNMLQELVVFRFSMVSEDLFARYPRPTYYLRSCFVFLSSLCFGCHQYKLFPESYSVLLATGLLYYFGLLYQCLVEMDEHKFVTAKIRLSIGLFFLSLISWQLISFKLQVDLIVRNLFWITIIFYAFIIVLSLNYRKYVVDRLCMEVIDNVHNYREFLIKIRQNFNFFVNFKSSESKTLRSAVICSHFKDCHNVECICRHRDQMYDPTKREWSDVAVAPHNDHVYCKHFINMMYQEGLTKFREFRLVTISHIYALWDMFRLYQRVLKEIEAYKAMFQKEMNVGDWFLIHHLKILIFEYLRSRSSTTQNLPVEEIEKFDNTFKSLQDHVHELTQFHQMFWKQLSQNIVDRKDLHSISNQICQLKHIIQKEYQDALTYSNKSYLLMMLMHKYTTKIIFDLKLAQKIHKDLPFTVRERSDGSTYGISDRFKIDEATCTVKVSTSQEDFSQIQWTSNRFSALLGWQKQDIIGKPIEILMPLVYRRHHSQWIRSWKERGTELNMNQIKKIWVMEKNQILSSCMSFVKVVPLFTHIELVGMLKKSNDKEYILLGENGSIEAAGSRLCKDLLMVEPAVLLESKIPLYVFSPELAREYKAKKTLSSQTGVVHLLVPKNLDNYIARFCYEKQFIDSHQKQNTEKTTQKQVERLCFTMSQDLVTAAESLATVAQLTLTIEQHCHKTATGKINLTVIKITDFMILDSLPAVLRQVQDQIKENTIFRINTLREERRPKEKVFSEVLCKAMSERCSRYSIQKMGATRRKEINMVKSIMNRCTEESYRKVLTKDLSPKRTVIERTREKIKLALYRMGIFGRSKLSYFYDKRLAKLDWGSRKNSKTQRTCRPGSIISSKTLEMMATNDKRLEESEKVQWVENEHELTSIKSSLASDGADLDFEELKKRVGSNEEHTSLKKYKIVMIIVMLFYIVQRTIFWQVRTMIRDSSKNLVNGLSEITQISVLLGLSINSVELMQFQQTDEVVDAAAACNNRLANLLSNHALLKNTKTIDGWSVYAYLQRQMDMELPGNQTKTLKVLNVMKTYQLLITDFTESLSSVSAAILQLNYDKIQQILLTSFNDGVQHMATILFAFRIVLIVHLFVSWAAYPLVALMLWLYARKGQQWIELSLDMISSISISIANGCCKYYRKLTEGMKEKKEDNDLQDIELYITMADLSNHRLDNSKGRVKIWFGVPSIIFILLMSFIEVGTINGLNVMNNLNSFQTALINMRNSQYSLVRDFIRVKQGIRINSTQKIQKRHQFITYTQEAFRLLTGLDEFKQLQRSMSDDICSRHNNYPLVLNLPSCTKKYINRYGLLLQVESLYGYLQSAVQLDQQKFVENPLLMQNQLSIYYTYNAWISVWLIFKQANNRITSNLVSDSRLFNFLGYVCLFLVAILCTILCRIISQSVNKVNSHILIVPRRFLRESPYAKRLLKKFL